MVLLISMGFILNSCGTGRITSLEKKTDEAIIIAKVQIKNGEVYLDNKWNFLLDERLLAKWAVWPDDQHYIYMKVPLGKHFIALLQYNEFSKNIPDDYLTIDITESKIYYIGDITLHWNIDKKADIQNRNGVAGAIQDSKKAGAYISVDVIDNYDTAVKYFNSKFPNDATIEKTLL